MTNTYNPVILVNPTEQDIFNTVARHLLTQGKKSMLKKPHMHNPRDTTNYDNCAYRGADNCMCGIGVLISNENYKPEMEGRAGISLTMRDGMPDWFKEMDGSLVYRIQHIHDTAPDDPEEFKKHILDRMTRLAVIKSFSRKVLDEFV